MARTREASGRAPSPGVDPVIRVPGITGTLLCGVDLGVCRAFGSAVARGRPREDRRGPREPWMTLRERRRSSPGHPPASVPSSRASSRDRHEVRVEASTADLAEPNAPPPIAARVTALGMRIDYLVNDAGSGGPDLLDDRDWSGQAAFLRLMMTSMAHLCHHDCPGPARARFTAASSTSPPWGERIARAGDLNYVQRPTWSRCRRCWI